MYQEMDPETKHVSVKLVFWITLVVFIVAVGIYFFITRYDFENQNTNDQDAQIAEWLAETTPTGEPGATSEEINQYLEETNASGDGASGATQEEIDAYLAETNASN